MYVTYFAKLTIKPFRCFTSDSYILWLYISDIFEDPLDEKWEVPRESIFIKDFAGEGAFGYVAKAEAFELPGNITTPCTVAVKMLKGIVHISNIVI